ncbi:uncharacterized protein DUF3823 [Mucilaginibacter auburnensis]|uniref:Uncharacterized protein DUF3823 n=2 Tax=Mucilaginibacter auburnensis TaxID=1457233 RepID=A0A2H9VN74_9SPHI|nr:uncharacterized protein DUF3823 [Mucilaginibacter auburnensis]
MLVIAASVLMQSCGKDNLKYPSSTLSGRLTYQGQPVGLIPSNPDIIGSANTATLLLQQTSGAQEVYGAGEVRIYAKNDGSFTSKFFDGKYLMRTQTSRSPFEDFTNRAVTVSGDTDLGNIEVVPYWWMNGLQTDYTAGVFTANFNLTKPSANTARTLERVYIFLSPTNLPDVQSSTQGVAKNWIAGFNSGGIVVPAGSSTGGTVTIKVDLNALTTGEKQFLKAFGNNTTVYATVAVKTTNINDALYSKPIQLKLPY